MCILYIIESRSCICAVAMDNIFACLCIHLMMKYVVQTIVNRRSFPLSVRRRSETYVWMDNVLILMGVRFLLKTVKPYIRSEFKLG
jgi:hypothetical protein